MDYDLLNEINAFLFRTKMGPAYFGKVACGNSRLVKRLENGGTVTVKTLVRVRDFMNSHTVAHEQ